MPTLLGTIIFKPLTIKENVQCNSRRNLLMPK